MPCEAAYIVMNNQSPKYLPTIVDGSRINGLYRAIIKYEKL
jgi:hypothetical protein